MVLSVTDAESNRRRSEGGGPAPIESGETDSDRRPSSFLSPGSDTFDPGEPTPDPEQPINRSEVAAVESAVREWGKTTHPLVPIALRLAEGLQFTRGQGQAAVAGRLVEILTLLEPKGSGVAEGDAGEKAKRSILSLVAEREARLDQAKREA
jgi:hypothetical protein